MPLPSKKTVSVQEALALWEQFNKEKSIESKVYPEYITRYCRRYEGLVGYKTSELSWRVYPDIFLQYLEDGFPDVLTRQPIMEAGAGLRYLHKNGIPSTYKFREMKKDFAERNMLIKPKKGARIQVMSVRRSDLNKFLKEWHGDG